MTKPTLNLVAIILTIFFYSCDNDDNIQVETLEEVITIPIVVHVVNYAPDPFTISDEKIKSQIDVLNQDFRKKNSDHTNTPNEFKDLIADVGIEFRLATMDPNGNSSTGIIRRESEVTGWDGQIAPGDIPIEDFKLYYTDKGGQDAWPNDKYLNIWIADLSNRLGALLLAGYAQSPGSNPRIDGVVIDPRVFGTLSPLEPGHELGRTATHEIGHWLNLKHIYGLDGNCEDGDLVDDTPQQKSQYSGNPIHPQNSCSSNDMFMNFMDYVADDAMCMFTKGQKERMRTLFNEGGLRRELYLNNNN